MERQQLLGSLERLRAELEQSETLDDQARTHLRGLAAEIEEFLGGDEGEAPLSFRERLHEHALELDAHHPVLTAVIREVTEFLARVGI